ncbi:MAG TPA: PBP1A family penicillin-binding protein [Pseudogracilibacillus sp.]|nr:PBP1A family penicillin-binding protein [Pseudogracilibacillus sp.]
MTENKSRSARKKQNKPKKKKPVFKTLIKIMMTVILLLGLAVAGIFTYFIIDAPKISPEQLDVSYASQYYDQDGEIFADRGDENRIKIEYKDVPDILIDAVTATEDVRFFEHPGVDIRRIFGAIKANIQRGFGAEGASTITQQVAENLFLTPDKTIKLKVQEQWIALKLEREFSKEQIMEMYLNKIFYGSNAYGVAKAAEVYFGKDDLHDLTLIEAAMLAGLPQRPSAYNPFQSPELMQERVDTVLNLMVRHGKITEQEADEARAIDVKDVLTDKKPKAFAYDAFIQQIDKELEEKLDDVNIMTAGLKVYTTLDRKAQDHVEFLLTDSSENPINYPDEDLYAGMTVVDTKSGAIRAIGGSRNRDTAFGSNYAINAHRQPGSTVKPILAYGPAIEFEKWSTYHQILDEAYTPAGSNPMRNWDRKYHGWISAREALKQSYNIPAAKTFEEIGSERVKSFAEDLGLTFKTDILDPRDVIGGTSNEASPLQLAGAFSAFGNEGIYTTPYAVTKVEFPDGTIVDLKPKAEAVMADYTAYMVTDMLKDVVNEGTGTNANIPEIPIAGKTGTTNLEGVSGANNSWFVGYSTNYSIAVWTGYKENTRVLSDTQVPHALFKSTMREISKDVETKDFNKPNSVVELNIAKGSNPPRVVSSGGVKELFVKGTEPKGNARPEEEETDELKPVSNLTASYNESSDSIDVSWDYSETDVDFQVSYQVDDGGMNELTTTSSKEIAISGVEQGKTYTIQVVVINSENEKSEPASTSITINEEEDIGEISGLNASYDEGNNAIKTSWSYDGPSASFEVDYNGTKQTTSSTSDQLSNVTRGTTYTITVTPIVDGERGESVTASVDVPEEEQNNNNNNEANREEENNNEPEDNFNDNNNEDNDNNNNNNDD